MEQPSLLWETNNKPFYKIIHSDINKNTWQG